MFQGLFVADTNSTNHANKADSMLNLSVYFLNIMSMVVHLSFMFTNHVNKIIFKHPPNRFSVVRCIKSHTLSTKTIGIGDGCLLNFLQIFYDGIVTFHSGVLAQLFHWHLLSNGVQFVAFT